MGQDKQDHGQRRIQRRTIYGEPIRLGERSLVPVADIVTFGRARATIGSRSTGGWGWGAARITPRAAIVQEAGGEGRVEIVDATARLVCQLAIMAVVSSVALAMVRWAVRWLRETNG